MKRLRSEITLGEIEIPIINQVSINSTWKQLTDTCDIIFPNKFINQNGNEIDLFRDELIERGDEVTIKLGYHPELTTRFEGFISKIFPGHPMRVRAEDLMYKAKFENVDLDHEGKLSEFVKKIDQPLEVNVKDVEMGKFRVDDVTLPDVLEELESIYGVSSWVRDGKIQIGVPYTLDKTHRFKFQHNIIQDDLEFMRKENVRVSVKAVSLFSDGSSETVTVGEGATQRTVFAHEVPKDELKRIAQRKLDRFKFTGYQGGFTTFGEPHVRHGEKVEVVDDTLPEREGTYSVDAVTTTFGFDGFRQKIDLGPQI